MRKKFILSKTTMRRINRALNQASDALIDLGGVAEDLRLKLDREDATARELAACDALEDLADRAGEVEVDVNNLQDYSDKLRRFLR